MEKIRPFTRWLASVALALALSGCALTSARIQGGKMSYTGLAAVSAQQSQDPKDRSNINTESLRQSEIVLPAGSQVTIPSVSSNRPVTVTLSSNAVYKVTAQDKVSSVAGAAQKNTLGETIAKLASLRWLTWLGAFLVLFGAASAVYPPLKLIVNSLTTSLVIVGVGVAFIALPSLIVGHELLILSIGAGAVGLYWFAHRHGSLKGELTALKNTLTGKKDSDSKSTTEGK